MKIQYGNKTWNIAPYFLVFIIILFTDRLLLDFFLDPEQPSAGTRDLLTGLSLLFSLFLLFRLKNATLKLWLFLCFLYIGFLFLESYFHYRTFFVYPHVFSKITEVFLLPFAYIFFLNKGKKYVKNMAYFIAIIFIVHIIFLKPEVFSITSFLITHRGVPASSVLLLIIPALYFFNQYMTNNKMLTLLALLVILFLILFLQHRSVWIATVTAFILNIILVNRKASFKIKNSSIAFIFLVPAVIALIFSSLILTKNPEVIEKFKDRVEDIQKIDEQGTGSWRLKQAESYWPFIKNHLLFGMRFKGYELPIQFYEESSGDIYFEDKTGHHFHSFYIDALFYLGLIGLLLKIYPFFHVIRLGFKSKALTIPQLTLISFSGCNIIYGLAYDFPMMLFGFVGIALAHLDQDADFMVSSNEDEPKLVAQEAVELIKYD